MTDTGQVPGEGLPENAGMGEQPGAPAPDAYAYLSDDTAEDDDLLLLPGAQGAWGNEVAPPAPEPVVEAVPEPAVEPVYEPGPHEVSGRDSGSVDLGGVRLPDQAPDHAQLQAQAQEPAPAVPPRRPLHLGPPIPSTAASPVRSLADRGPAAAPSRQSGAPAPAPAPEYLDAPQAAAMPPQGAAPWGAPAPAPTQEPTSAAAEPAETVVPTPEHTPDAGGAAEAVVARVATEAVAATGGAPADARGDGVTGDAAGPGGPDDSGNDSGDPADSAPPVQAPAVPEATPAAGPAPEAGAPQEAEPYAAESRVPETPQAPEAVETAETVEPPAPQGAPEDAEQQAVAAAPAMEQPSDAPEPAPGPAPAVEAPGVEAVGEEAAAQQVAADQPEAVVPEPVVPEPVVPEPVVPEAVAPEPVGPGPVAPEEGTHPHPETQPAQGPQSAPDAQAHPGAAATDVPQAPGPQPAVQQADQGAPAEVPAEPAASAEPVAPVEPVESAQPAVAEAPAGPADAPADAPVHTPAEVPVGPGPVPHPDASLGQFVPVEGQVPTTPQLAPTPPQALTVPAEPETDAAVPAPREAESEQSPELAQSADDLDTRDADQEEPEAQEEQAAREAQQPVAEVRQSTGPAAPAYDDAEREAVLKVMRERRDIRNGFRSDPIPHEVLLRVLEAAHTAPSVGHSQPWDFVVIRSADTRRAMHELATRQREAYAKSLPKGRAKQFKELKIEAILDTPVNIVVTADPTRGGRHTLGRHTQPQMAPYSSALAVENLWLAARAEGLGVGWVSFFDEREMVRALGLPEHLEVVAYLCVGYVDEFPDEPELMQAGWSKRRPLSWVVHEETYGRRALPGEEPHDLLAETVAQIRPLDAKALGEAWERQKRMTKPAGALGMLEIISAQLSGLSRQCPPPIPEPAAVAIFAGDHGVHAQGVTPWPQEVTGQMVANFLGGGAVCNAFATQVGAEVCVVDVGVATDLPATPGLLPRKVRAGTADMTAGPAMTREEVKQAIEVGIETARDLVAAGNKALLTGEMGIANTTASAALISVFTGADPAEVTGRGTGINDETLARKTEVVRRAIEVHQPDPADPIGVLSAIGGLEHAAMVGLLLGGASLRTPVILDGVSAGAAALVARAIAPEVLAACIAGHRSAEPGHVAALNKLGLRPLVDLDLRLGEGTGALLALPMVQSTARAMHEVATFDSAGVTEK
ncbi:nicotinate-nucleotide--dimethylbenzimidazole phosphoribosyltransferase [Streptomyces sp. HMX87]|uniref:nicotinate-nucleotide--dimethylbenzimidazole phosphoribosyltransferase n=1 Tax=Streptomyces sp. HMX87 TaxID=3390849 RepID=UPI003A83A294